MGIVDLPMEGDHVLVIELSGAAFEMALLEVDGGMVETLAYEARIYLGQDVVALKVLEEKTDKMRNDDLNTTAMAAMKLELHNAAAFNMSNANSTLLSVLANLREECSRHIQQVLERFMTNAVQKWLELAGRLPDRMETILPGDHSWSDFATLDKVTLKAANLPKRCLVAYLHLPRN